MELEKYFDPRGKSFTDDVEMMYENINRIRSGARGSSSAPAPISYADIRVRDDMPSNYRGLIGGVTGDLGTATGGSSARSRLSEIGGFTEVQRLIEQGILDENFVEDAVKDMSYQEREDMFTRNIGLPSSEFKVVVDALGGPRAPDMQSYINHVYSLEKQVPEAAERLNLDFNRQLVEGAFGAAERGEGTGTPVKRQVGAPSPQAAQPRKQAAKAPSAAPVRGSNLLAMGSRGAGVQKVQEDLTALNQLENILGGKMTGAGGPFDPGVSGVDGVFGEDTQAAVKAFQKSAGITDDGIVGPDTRDALKKALDASKSAVKLQRSQAEEIKSMPSPAEPPAFGADITRVDEGVFDAAANEFEDMRIIPTKADTEPERRMPIDNVQAYEDLELDEAPRRSAFPMFRSRRNRR